MPTLYFTIGISGSGKSTYLKKNFKPEVIVNPDFMRKELTGDISNHSKDSKIWMELVPNKLKECLNLYGIAVLDATNVDSSSRGKILKLFGNSVKKIALVFQSNVQVSKDRIKNDLKLNVDRSSVPDDVIDKQYKKLINGYKNMESQFDKVININENASVENNDAETNKKSINDEFIISARGLSELESTIEKVNKSLKSRNLKPLEIKILGTEEIRAPMASPEEMEFFDIKTFFTVKIDGEIPEVHDYDFIAKIEHTDTGNIINMNPKASASDLPSDYKTFNQKCDICKSNRERLNTFILKKIESGEIIVAGSTCLKKFLPLDAVKAFLEYSIQLKVLRDFLVELEIERSENERGTGGTGGISYLPEQVLFSCCLSYINNNYVYTSKQKAMEFDKESTASHGRYILSILQGHGTTQERKIINEIISKHGKEAKELSKKIFDWAKDFDYDQAALDNPNFESYYHNLKVLINRPLLKPQHTGYFSSLIAMYARYTMPKKETSKTEKKDSKFVGSIGDKISKHVILKSSRTYQSQYGNGEVFTFEDDDGNIFLWFTSSIIFVDKAGEQSNLGQLIDKSMTINGTVKNHQENKYNKRNETILKNVKITSFDDSSIKIVKESINVLKPSEIRTIIKEEFIQILKNYII